MEKLVPALLISLLVVLSACIGGGSGGGETITKYVCPNEMVVTNPKHCPRMEKEGCEETVIYRYVCLDGTTVNETDGCPQQKPTVKLRYVCLDARVVDDPGGCGDNSSNITAVTSTTTSTSTTVTVTGRDVEITEIDLIGEWVKIKNRGVDPVVFGGWTLEDEGNHVYEFPADFILKADSSVRVYTEKGSDSNSRLYWGRSSKVWNDGGDTATLRDEKGGIVDKLSMLPITTTASTTSTSETTSTSVVSTSSSSSTTTPTTTASTTSTTSTASTSTTSTTSVPLGAIIVNEVMYHPDECSDSYCEWIEIHNTAGYDINLSEWTICGNQVLEGYVNYTDEKTYSAQGTVILSGGYALVTDGGSGTEVYDNFDVDQNSLALHVDVGGICGGLHNSGDTIDLKDGMGTQIDYIAYNGSVGANGNNLTLIREGDHLIEGAVMHGTPGSVNT